MQIKLNKIKYGNFKCFKQKQFDYNGLNALIRGENGRGKTSAMDGFYWLHTDKDSSGRKQFKMRPLDKENQPIKGLVTFVEDELLVNGTPHTFRKEQHERIVKKDIVGFTNLYWIDDVPQKEKEFKEYHENLCPEEIFKILTDLDYFNGKLQQADRRRRLVDVAGNIPDPAGFEGLLSKLNGRDMKDYEKMLADQKKAYVKERDEINPRIDELQKGLTDYAQNHPGDSEPELIAKRDDCQEKVDGLIKQRDELLATVTKRQKIAEQINELQGKKLHRENIVKNQTGAVDSLLDERNQLEKDHADKTQELVDLQNLISEAKSAIDSAQNQIDQSLLTLKNIKEEYKNADSPLCSLCGQAWPADKPKPGLADIEARGNGVRSIIDRTKAKKADLQEELNKLLAEEKEKVGELKTAKAVKDNRIAEINEQIKNRPEPDPEQDEEWQKITANIKKLQGELGEPVSQQLDQIEAEKGLAETLLNELNKNLNKFDTNEKTKARIIELENRNGELTQQIANVDKELDEIGRFKIAESKMVEASVNDMFKHVEWKLFEYYLNGEIKEICEAIYKTNGVPYSDMSTGQKFFCGIDVINTMSDYYGVEVPLFIDDAADLTLPIEAESQTIILDATFVYNCVACGEHTYKNWNPKSEEDIPDTVRCDHCEASAKRHKELVVEVEQAVEAGKAVA